MREFCHSAGLNSIKLDVYKNNMRAIRIYQRTCFRIVAKLSKEYEMERVLHDIEA